MRLIGRAAAMTAALGMTAFMSGLVLLLLAADLFGSVELNLGRALRDFKDALIGQHHVLYREIERRQEQGYRLYMGDHYSNWDNFPHRIDESLCVLQKLGPEGGEPDQITIAQKRPGGRASYLEIEAAQARGFGMSAGEIARLARERCEFGGERQAG